MDKMPSDIKSGKEYTVPARHMRYSLETRRSSIQQQCPDPAKEKVFSPLANRSSKSQERLKIENSYDRLCTNRKLEVGQKAVDDTSSKLRSSGDLQKQQPRSTGKKDDELVKHMSNLPGYLQQVEKGKNVQEKALNVGVLDWDRLQNWKYNERMPARVQRKAAPSTSNSLYVASRPSSLSSVSPQRKSSTLCSSNLSSSPGKRLLGLQQPQHNLQVQDSQATPIHALHGHKTNRERKVKASSRISLIKTDKGNARPVSEKEEMSSNQIKQRLSIPSQDMVGAEPAKDMNEMKMEDEISLSPQNCPAESQSIVVLVPKHSSKKNSSEFSRISGPQPYQLAQVNNESTLSDCSTSKEFPLGTSYHDIPRSYPLSGAVATDNKAHMKPQSSMFGEGTVSGKLLHHCENTTTVTPKPSEAERLEAAGHGMDASVTIEKDKKMDVDNVEQSSAKGRHPSPIRRFSFSLGRMKRSFSFKESSAVPPLSSNYTVTKSGPVKFDSSFVMDNCNEDKPNSSSRGRSSPLRRLLDPLLKPKGPLSAQPVQPSGGNSNSVAFKPINIREPLPEKKNRASTSQALLQLSLKNGAPFFKFVVNNSSDILVAAVKTLPDFEKSDLVYAFYSVHEIKKKSGGWLSQGSKGKSCGFGYNIVSQMKISSPFLSDCRDQQIVRESVLYNVDTGHVDKQAPEFCPNREIAAVVIKNCSETLKNEEPIHTYKEHEQKESMNCSPRHTSNKGENDSLKSITVILPGGFHSLPNKGAPSSLIYRWKSGGACDCGGWDVGCKLRILTNQVQSSKTSVSSTSCSGLNHLDLYIQGEDQATKPIFSLSLLQDGLYSVVFNASITLLEAFSTCVTIITNEKFADVLELNNISEANVIRGSERGNDLKKTAMMIQGQIPIKFVASPPPSPVGRI